MPNNAVLVTGAAGFIGSHLCDRLLKDGDKVTGVDNLITGARRNLMHLADHPNFQFYEFDVTSPVLVEGEFDHVWHLASLASPMAYLAHPIETMETGSTATRNMLEVAKRDNARFLLTSTSECYGDPLERARHLIEEDLDQGLIRPATARRVYGFARRS